MFGMTFGGVGGLRRLRGGVGIGWGGLFRILLLLLRMFGGVGLCILLLMTGGLFRPGLLLPLMGSSFPPLPLSLDPILGRLGSGCGGLGWLIWFGKVYIPGISLLFRCLFCLSWFGGLGLFGGGFMLSIGMLVMGLSFIGLIWLGGFLGGRLG